MFNAMELSQMTHLPSGGSLRIHAGEERLRSEKAPLHSRASAPGPSPSATRHRSKHREIRKQPTLESKPLVKLHSSSIIRPHMKNRSFAPPPNPLRQNRHKKTRIAMPQMFRMRAHSANLRITGKLQPLAGHGDQLSLLANPQVRPHFPCPSVERPGLRQGSQLNHLRHIRLPKFDEIMRKINGVMRLSIGLKPRIVLQNHLQQSAVEHDLKPLRRVHPLRKKQTQSTARRKQPPHRRESLRIRLGESAQRRHLRRKPPQYAVSLSKIRLASPQRIKYWIIELVHPAAPKRRKHSGAVTILDALHRILDST